MLLLLFIDEEISLGASVMAQRVKTLAAELDNLSVIPWDLHHGKKN